MDLRSFPPTTVKGRRPDCNSCELYASRETGITDFAQSFRTAALGLGCEEAALKEFLNLGLDDPLPQREMEGLRGFHYWGVVDYVGYRSLVMSCLFESNIVFPEMPHVDPNVLRGGGSLPVSYSQAKVEEESS
ncbi:proteoglycan 4-like protein [Labeo rohita]|uniref:Proteoglycan 4-like protein n=1 Tax=Labeo rohita TaxID=84645 RepID=A0A498LVL9_LABRO|nr:proteoglycan 4-like protein [Labeo rohita]RXN37429.1 proteoglycan 4-like protein [Labeo rohita]